MTVQEQIQQLDFIKDNFSPSEAIDLISTSIDKSINFYKIKYMSMWERNHNTDSTEIDNKIKELTNRKNTLIKRVNHAKADGVSISLDSILELKVVK